MRKITVLSMISLDGVMQAPGGPQEDPENNFRYGGWVAPYNDESTGGLMERLLKPADYLLGRKTFEIWENYWPQHTEFWPGINLGTKYVLTHTRSSSEWENTSFIQSVEDIRTLKHSPGMDIQVWGSSDLIQLLLEHDLVDELWLMIHPLTIGEGKKLFRAGTGAAAFTLEESIVTPRGVIIGNYKRAGEVITGTVGV